MRIAFVSTMGGFPWGGSEELWAEAATQARRRGHAVCAFVHRVGATVPEKLRRLQADGVTVIFRPATRHHRVDRLLSKLNLHWRKLLAWRPDVICLSQADAYDCASFEAIRNLFDAVGGVPSVMVNQLVRDASPLSPRQRDRARRAAAIAKHVLYVADANRQAAERHLAASLPNARVVRNPVNLSAVGALPWPSEQSVIFACVARLDILYKGQDLLLTALADDRWKNRQWRLRLVGSGPDREYLAQLIAHLGLAGRVELSGQLQDIRALWREAHLLLMCSRDEGTPLAMVEAMLCGRPVIATAVGGIPEWVVDGQNGFLAPAASVESMNQALERGWDAQSRWREMGEAAHQRACGLYDPQPGVTLLDLLESAVAAPAEGRPLASVSS